MGTFSLGNMLKNLGSCEMAGKRKDFCGTNVVGGNLLVGSMGLVSTKSKS